MLQTNCRMVFFLFAIKKEVVFNAVEQTFSFASIPYEWITQYKQCRYLGIWSDNQRKTRKQLQFLHVALYTLVFAKHTPNIEQINLRFDAFFFLRLILLLLLNLFFRSERPTIVNWT